MVNNKSMVTRTATPVNTIYDWRCGWPSAYRVWFPAIFTPFFNCYCISIRLCHVTVVRTYKITDVDPVSLSLQFQKNEGTIRFVLMWRVRVCITLMLFHCKRIANNKNKKDNTHRTILSNKTDKIRKPDTLACIDVCCYAMYKILWTSILYTNDVLSYVHLVCWCRAHWIYICESNSDWGWKHETRINIFTSLKMYV